jgi:hypothetical protein
MQRWFGRLVLGAELVLIPALLPACDSSRRSSNTDSRSTSTDSWSSISDTRGSDKSISVKPSFGPSSSESPKDPSGLGSTGDWKEFSNTRGKFQVLMPGTPSNTVLDVPTDDGKVKWTSNTAVLKGTPFTSFTVQFCDYPPETDFSDETVVHEEIDRYVAAYAQALEWDVQKKSKIHLGNHPGQECLLKYKGGTEKRLLRIYLVGNRMYVLTSVWQPESQTSANAEKFMNSFKLID